MKDYNAQLAQIADYYAVDGEIHWSGIGKKNSDEKARFEGYLGERNSEPTEHLRVIFDKEKETVTIFNFLDEGKFTRNVYPMPFQYIELS